ncbi:hypothetical protein GCM10009101_01670 [Brevundimonas lenta]
MPTVYPEIAALRQAKIVVCGEIEQDQIGTDADRMYPLPEPPAVNIGRPIG